MLGCEELDFILENAKKNEALDHPYIHEGICIRRRKREEKGNCEAPRGVAKAHEHTHEGDRVGEPL